MTPLLRKRYMTWRPQAPPSRDGYTLLMPVPGDLPILTRLALDVCRRQDPTGRRETLLLPDRLTPEWLDLVALLTATPDAGAVRWVALDTFDALMAERYPDAALINWLQWVRGVEAVTTPHAVWHDSDLFFTDPRFLLDHVTTCVARGLAVYGVSPPWDAWYAACELHHVTAAWEIAFAVDWARRFTPWEHRGQEAWYAGQLRRFDITCWPQVNTPAARIGRRPDEQGFVHFNYVASTYRALQAAIGPFEDTHYRLLLLRLLADAYGEPSSAASIPTLGDLIAGSEDDAARVTYRRATTRANWPAFRAKLAPLLAGGILDGATTDGLREGVARFAGAHGDA